MEAESILTLLDLREVRMSILKPGCGEFNQMPTHVFRFLKLHVVFLAKIAGPKVWWRLGEPIGRQKLTFELGKACIAGQADRILRRRR
jgi:hypothetical protein